MIQWLGLLALTAKDGVLILGWGTKIPQVTQHGQKKKPNQKQRLMGFQRVHSSKKKSSGLKALGSVLGWNAGQEPDGRPRKDPRGLDVVGARLGSVCGP